MGNGNLEGYMTETLPKAEQKKIAESTQRISKILPRYSV